MYKCILFLLLLKPVQGGLLNDLKHSESIRFVSNLSYIDDEISFGINKSGRIRIDMFYDSCVISTSNRLQDKTKALYCKTQRYSFDNDRTSRFYLLSLYDNQNNYTDDVMVTIKLHKINGKDILRVFPDDYIKRGKTIKWKKGHFRLGDSPFYVEYIKGKERDSIESVKYSVDSIRARSIDLSNMYNNSPYLKLDEQEKISGVVDMSKVVEVYQRIGIYMRHKGDKTIIDSYVKDSESVNVSQELYDAVMGTTYNSAQKIKGFQIGSTE